MLIGAGATFIAGADIKAFDRLETPDQSLQRSAGIHALLGRLEDGSLLRRERDEEPASPSEAGLEVAPTVRLARPSKRLDLPDFRPQDLAW